MLNESVDCYIPSSRANSSPGRLFKLRSLAPGIFNLPKNRQLPIVIEPGTVTYVTRRAVDIVACKDYLEALERDVDLIFNSESSTPSKNYILIVTETDGESIENFEGIFSIDPEVISTPTKYITQLLELRPTNIEATVLLDLLKPSK